MELSQDPPLWFYLLGAAAVAGLVTLFWRSRSSLVDLDWRGRSPRRTS